MSNSDNLITIAENIWLCDGEDVNFYGFSYSTRMTIIRLPNNQLWIHSPIRLNESLQQALKELGEVRYLIAPNKLHHLFLSDWVAAYPKALTFGTHEVCKKRDDISFTAELTDTPETHWQQEIDQTIFHGSPAMEEAVFYHKPSKTLIVTDLIENFDPDHFSRWQRAIARFTGVLAPHGKMPADWRLSFSFGSKQQALQSLDLILSWDIKTIILAHGECIFQDARAFLIESFKWLEEHH
ncbi:DUF4336 domain-containing protein [Zooshikella harenae]|uniref:DUF4336 domain-containing protein n=1 Tax=Zooshikella harenae TaxID=2827238 RepID=A0ABS5ZAH9_9GAMM|nr:DUF4336 domain-containing protein [Zooshikella harenae]MBU2711035.1 DUF4336 domain-containing protein [Zooshikella harenae]